MKKNENNDKDLNTDNCTAGDQDFDKADCKDGNVEMLTRRSSGIDWFITLKAVGGFLSISPGFYIHTHKLY